MPFFRISQAHFFNDNNKSNQPLDFDPKEDYYKILEIREKASEAEIKNGFFRLAQFYHPDRNQGHQHNLTKFQNITNAYQVLKDPQKRQRYDEIRAGPTAEQKERPKSKST